MAYIENIDKENPDAVLTVFTSRVMSIQYIFKDGFIAEFVGYKFYTNNPDHVAELLKEIKLGHPHIYQTAEKEVKSNPEDPIKALKEKMRAEILAEERIRIQSAHGRDMGSSEQDTKITPLNTADVASGMAGSDSGTASAVADFISVSGVNPAVASGLAALKTSTAKK